MDDDLEQYSRLLGAITVLEVVVAEIGKSLALQERSRIVAALEQIKASAGDSFNGRSQHEAATRLLKEFYD